MIVISMLLVIVGAVTLVIGVFFVENLQFVFVSIVSCLLAGLFLVVGVIRGRPSRTAATAGAGEAGVGAPPDTWGPSGAGATEGWGPPAGAQGSETALGSPVGQEDTHAPGPDTSWAPAGSETLEDVGEGDVRVLEPEEEPAGFEPEGEVAQTEALRDEVVPPKGAAKKTARKAAGRKAAKAGGKKAAGKKATAGGKKAAGKKATAGGKKAAGKKATAGGKKAAGKKVAGKKAAGKKAAGKKAAGKKAAGKKAAGKKAAGKKAAGKKAAGKKAAGKKTASGGQQRIEQTLADVSGVGGAKREAVAEHFGSYQRLRNASVEDIAEVRGISPELAQRIYDRLHA